MIMISSIHPTTRLGCEMHEPYVQAKDKLDSYSFFFAAVDHICAISSIETVQHRAMQWMTLKQGSMPHENYAMEVQDGAIRFTHDLEDPVNKGFVKIAHLKALIYLAGVNEATFKPVRDEVFVKATSARIDDIEKIIAKFQDYSTTRAIMAPPELDPTPLHGLAAISTEPTPPASYKCMLCNKKFTPGKSKRGEYNKLCSACWSLRKTSEKNSSESKKVNESTKESEVKKSKESNLKSLSKDKKFLKKLATYMAKAEHETSSDEPSYP